MQSNFEKVKLREYQCGSCKLTDRRRAKLINRSKEICLNLVQKPLQVANLLCPVEEIDYS